MSATSIRIEDADILSRVHALQAASAPANIAPLASVSAEMTASVLDAATGSLVADGAGAGGGGGAHADGSGAGAAPVVASGLPFMTAGGFDALATMPAPGEADNSSFGLE